MSLLTYKSIKKEHISITLILLIGRELVLTAFQWHFSLGFIIIIFFEKHAYGNPELALNQATAGL